jgi:hypothetical protein
MAGYNQNFESYVSAGSTYNTYYIRFTEYDKSAYQWGDYIPQESMVIVALPIVSGNGLIAAFEDALAGTSGNSYNGPLGLYTDNSAPAPSTTTSTTTTGTSTTTTTTTTLIP